MKNQIPSLEKIGSYKDEDVIFLLQDISKYNLDIEMKDTNERFISKKHYSEWIPFEYQPGYEYMELFKKMLKLNSKKIAVLVGIVAEQIIKKNGLENLVLVSLVRAGTPIGVLITRYIKFKYDYKVPHYSISIIPGREIDKVALDFIINHHPHSHIQFIDGWTGKGTINQVLRYACEEYNNTKVYQLNSSLAVLADPGHCADLYGTRRDILIPSSCLNSTISGLISRSVLNHDFMNKDDFHGSKYYKEFADYDLSNYYVDFIEAEFDSKDNKIENHESSTWKGIDQIEKIMGKYGILDKNSVKPGVNETTRVLLRKPPWKILINPEYSSELDHIFLLARERMVLVEEYSEMNYSCCGLIKD